MGFNRMSGDEVARAIDERVRSVAQEVYTRNPANRTAYGRVVSSSNGYYSVEINSHTYNNVPSLRNTGTIDNNATVLCLIPNNEYANMVILGVADGETTIGTPKGLLNLIFPIGSVYLSIEDASPAMLLGGTWAKIEEGKALWTASEQAGEILNAGLPNIRGSIGSTTSGVNGVYSNMATSGALSFTAGNADRPAYSTTNGGSTLNFNANDSNAIYRDDVSTVQPPAYTIFAWRRVA